MNIYYRIYLNMSRPLGSVDEKLSEVILSGAYFKEDDKPYAELMINEINGLKENKIAFLEKVETEAEHEFLICESNLIYNDNDPETKIEYFFKISTEDEVLLEFNEFAYSSIEGLDYIKCDDETAKGMIIDILDNELFYPDELHNEQEIEAREIDIFHDFLRENM